MLVQQMYPVKALEFYLHRTREARGQTEAWFGHYDPDKGVHEVS